MLERVHLRKIGIQPTTFDCWMKPAPMIRLLCHDFIQGCCISLRLLAASVWMPLGASRALHLGYTIFNQVRVVRKHNQMPNWLSHARYLMYQTCASTPFSTASLPLIPSRQSITALIDSGPVKEPVTALCHSAHKLSAVCSDIMGQCSVFTDPTT